MSFSFKIQKKLQDNLGRAGILSTPHGDILTPTFANVGTKGSVKTLTPEHLKELGTQVVLANTYHLYLQPGEDVLKKAGGIGKFMNWNGPTMTDSGGFQAFSLGVAFGQKLSKISGEFGRPDSSESGLGKKIGKLAHVKQDVGDKERNEIAQLAKITEDGVEFKSVLDGSTHFFTPERSIEIQHAIGADMIFAFDECTSPIASHQYQKEAMDRTHRWAERSLRRHRELQDERLKLEDEDVKPQAIFGIVQGGRFEDLRTESAKIIGGMDFDGFGIGGSFEKEDIDKVVHLVNEILPEGKPRHLLGIGDPVDLFEAVENGCDLFDCVAPTRIARHGTLYSKNGLVHISNGQYRNDFSSVVEGCECYTCKNFTKAYLGHLFRAHEYLAYTLSSIHNLYFIVNLLKTMRQGILEGNFSEIKTDFLKYFNP